VPASTQCEAVSRGLCGPPESHGLSGSAEGCRRALAVAALPEAVVALLEAGAALLEAAPVDVPTLSLITAGSPADPDGDVLAGDLDPDSCPTVTVPDREGCSAGALGPAARDLPAEGGPVSADRPAEPALDVAPAEVAGAVVSGAVVSGAVVSGAVVSGAVVSGAVVSGADWPPGAG